MANEATQIPNPSTMVSTESLGYGRQNTKMAAGFVGLDTTAPYLSGGNIVIPVGGIVEVNGVLYKIETQATLSPTANVKNYIKLVVGLTGLTPTIDTSSGTYSATKCGRYSAGNERILNWVFQFRTLRKINPVNGNIVSENTPENEISNALRREVLEWPFVKSRFATPSGSPYGVAVDQITGNLISCNDGPDLIYIHNGISSTILSSFASPGSLPTGITIDQITGNLISCDNTSDLIYIHSGITSSILSSFATPALTPTGLSVNQITGNLISCNNDAINYIHIHGF